MNVRDFECRSLEEARVLLGNRPRRTVCNNTGLRQYPTMDCIGLELHGHEIARFFPGGHVWLSSCGYYTVTTKDRLNRVLPKGWQLYQIQKQWWLRTPKNEKMSFVDGIVIE